MMVTAAQTSCTLNVEQTLPLFWQISSGFATGFDKWSRGSWFRWMTGSCSAVLPVDFSSWNDSKIAKEVFIWLDSGGSVCSVDGGWLLMGSKFPFGVVKCLGPKWRWSVQFSSVTQSCSTLCDPMNHSTPGLPVHHQFPEFTQTHVHWVPHAIQLSHPLLSPSPPAFNLSQHQGLFKWVSFSHQVSKVLKFQLQQQSFQWTLRTDFLGWTGWISQLSKGLSRVFSNTIVQKHQFFSAQLSL